MAEYRTFMTTWLTGYSGSGRPDTVSLHRPFNSVKEVLRSDLTSADLRLDQNGRTDRTDTRLARILVFDRRYTLGQSLRTAVRPKLGRTGRAGGHSLNKVMRCKRRSTMKGWGR